MKAALLASVLFVVIASSTTSFGQGFDDALYRVESIQSLVAKHQFSEIKLSHGGSILRLLSKPLAPDVSLTSSEDIANAFIRDNVDILGVLERSSLSKSIDKLVGGGRRLMRFQQYYDGVPVYNRSVSLFIAESVGDEYPIGTVLRIKNDSDFEKDIVLGNESKMSTAEVSNHVERLILDRDWDLKLLHLDPFILSPKPDINESHLHVYRALLGDTLSTYQMFVDAQDLSIISEEPTSSGLSNVRERLDEHKSGAHPVRHGPIFGVPNSIPVPCASNLGYVYAINPGEASHTTKSLLNIDHTPHPDRLYGANVQIKVDDSSTSPVANVSYCYFFFNESPNYDRERKDATNVYYHVTNFLDVFNISPPSGSIVVRTEKSTTRVLIDPIGSFVDQRIELDPFNSALYDNNLQRASDVIVHEYVHLLTWEENNSMFGDIGEKRVWEGYSDAIAIIYNAEIGYTETQIFKWLLGTKSATGQNMMGLRNISTNHLWAGMEASDYNGNYLDGNKDEYDGSLVVSSLLWDFRSASSMADEDIVKMIIDSSLYLGSNFDGPDIISALQDTSYCNSTCDSQLANLESRFDDTPEPFRDFGNGRTTEIERTVSQNKDVGVFEIVTYPNPSSSTIHVRPVASQIPGAKYRIEIYDLLGRQLHSSLVFVDAQTTIDITGLVSGLYLLSVTETVSGASRTELIVKQ